MTPSPAPILAALNAALEKPALGNLYCRWQDEKEYEEIADYADAFATATGLTVHRATKKPFGFIVSHPDFPEGRYHFTHNRREASWQRVKGE